MCRLALAVDVSDWNTVNLLAPQAIAANSTALEHGRWFPPMIRYAEAFTTMSFGISLLKLKTLSPSQLRLYTQAWQGMLPGKHMNCQLLSRP